MTSFEEVIRNWQNAPVSAIHPLRNVSEHEYWQSGVSQAEEMTEWLPKKGTVVDFGCGDGRIALPLSLLGYHVIAVDSSEKMLKRLFKNQTDRGGRVQQGIVSNGLDLSERLDRPVDAVMSRAVLIHHSHTDGSALVHALAAGVKKDGFFVADWPTGETHVRRDWIDVTLWEQQARKKVANNSGLTLVKNGPPSVWRKVV